MTSRNTPNLERISWWPPILGALVIAVLLLLPVGSLEAESWWPRWLDALWALNAYGVDKIVHIALFGMLAWALLRSPIVSTRLAAGWIIAVSAVYGSILEVAQIPVPGRSFELWDIAADVVGAVLVVWLASVKR